MRQPDECAPLTPVGELFTYHIFGIPDLCRHYQDNPDAYSLTVDGLVNQKLELSLKQLQSQFDAVAAEMVLQCMTNIHWGKIAVTGARLADILDHTGIQAEAWKIAFRGADGFETDLTIEEVKREPERFLLAYQINDAPITLEHGFPVRMAADGRYGYKWPKWLTTVTLVDYDHKGHYEGKRGWSDRGIRGQRVT